MGKNDLKKIIDFFWLFYHWLKHDDLSQNLFLEVKKPEIKETKGTFIIPKLKSSYWGPFSGLKSQDLIKTSRTFSGVIFCPRSFCAFSEYMNFISLEKKTSNHFSFLVFKLKTCDIWLFLHFYPHKHPSRLSNCKFLSFYSYLKTQRNNILCESVVHLHIIWSV